MKTYPLVALLLAGPVALSQGTKAMPTQLVQQSLDDIGNTRMVNMSRTFDNRTITTRGTPFYLPSWLSGEATIEGSQTRYRGQFKLDVMNDRLLVKQPQGDSIWVSAARLSTLTLNPLANDPASVRFRRFASAVADEPLLHTTFVRVLHEGAYGTLVQLPIRRLYKAAPSDSYSHHATTDEIRDESVYYVIHPDHTTEKVKLNRRSLIDAMGEAGRQLDNHARANNLSLRSQAEVIQALGALQSPVR